MDFGDLNDDNGANDEMGGTNHVDDLFLFSGMDQSEINSLKDQKDAVIFLVDCSSSMFQPNPNNPDHTSSIDQILKATLSFMKSKIITSDSDKIGIILYGCQQSQNTLNFPNIYVLQNLDATDAQIIKAFQQKVETFEHRPFQGQAPFFDALWICHQEFKSVEKQNYSKRIFLFTDDDQPYINEGDIKMTQQRADDLAQLKVDIELFPMPSPVVHLNDEGDEMPPKFDIKKFYAHVITMDEDEMLGDMLGIDGAQSRIFELMRRIRMKEFRKRAQGKCLFALNPKSQIALSFYSTIIPAKKPTPQRVNAVNNKLLRSTQRYICEETGQVLYRQQIGTYFPLGNEKVFITPEEVMKVKKFDKLGMTLMGFKPKSYLKVYHNTKHSTFVYPDEKTISGSSQCMDALVHEMQRKDKIAIVRVQVRDNAQVRFCALLPSYPKDANDEAQCGFQLIVLPYADDIRDLDSIMQTAGYPVEKRETEPAIVETLQKIEKDTAKLLIRNLTIDFDSRKFENPTVQKFYSGLQALALGEQEPEPVQDLLEPDYEGMKQFQPLINRFKDTFFDGQSCDQENVKKPAAKRAAVKKAPQERLVLPDDSSDEQSKDVPSRKRKADSSQASQALKRVKESQSSKATPVPKQSEDKVKDFSKMTVAELKAIIQEKEPELTVNGKKKDQLLAIVQNYYK